MTFRLVDAVRVTMQQLRAIYPVVGTALSGFGMEHDLARSREAGCREHPTKPVNFALLDAALTRWLQGGRGRGSGLKPLKKASSRM